MPYDKKFVRHIGTMLQNNKILIVLSFFLIASVLLWSFREPASYLVWEKLRSEKIALALNAADPGLQFAIGDYYFGRGAYDVTQAKMYFQATI